MRGQLIAILALAACGSAPPPSATPISSGQGEACPTERPTGAPTDYAAPTDLTGVTIAAPQSCELDSAYIRVERTDGARRIGTGRNANGGFDEGCATLPDPADASACPVINGGAVLMEASRLLNARGIQADSTGLGPCGDAGGDYDAWNMAFRVHDWKHAEAAVRQLSELLVTYDLRGHVGVGVAGIMCASLL